MNINNKATLSVSVKNRNEYADYDYLEKLSPSELNWLKGFHREFVNADFKHGYKKVHKRKSHIKDIYNKNNSRNRDIYGKKKVSNSLLYDVEPFKNKPGIVVKYNIHIMEDILIKGIDNEF